MYGIAKLFSELRTYHPVHIEEEALFFDKGLCGSIENIVVYGGPFFEDLQWRLASLPIRFGGLGLYITKMVSSYAFVAPRAQYWVLQGHILCGKDGDYVFALACLHDMIPSFNFSCFTNKDSAPSKSQQTPVNVLFSEMVKDMEVYFDMTVRQQVVFSLSSRGFTVGHAAFKAASCKVAKHEKACIENQHVFVSFAFDTFGFLAPEAVELLNRVQ
ncbi:hypothetical protein Tco_0788925 [Tanacetum coccineum]